jgi:hypothetical protein
MHSGEIVEKRSGRPGTPHVYTKWTGLVHSRCGGWMECGYVSARRTGGGVVAAGAKADEELALARSHQSDAVCPFARLLLPPASSPSCHRPHANEAWA